MSDICEPGSAKVHYGKAKGKEEPPLHLQPTIHLERAKVESAEELQVAC